MVVPGTHDARERLSRAAYELLREGGVSNASPALVAERAGASKMSLYRHFTGIDELLAVALGEHDAEHREHLLAGGTGTPRQHIEGMFAGAAARADRPGYRGCVYVDTRVEVNDADHPVALVAKRHKRAMIDTLTALLEQAGVAEPGSAGLVVQMLFDGAVVNAVVAGTGDPLRSALAALPQVVPELYPDGG
jgi:AcrR family transcriptional regulator